MHLTQFSGFAHQITGGADVCVGPLAGACVAPSYCGRNAATGVEVCNCLWGFDATDRCASSILVLAFAPAWLGLRYAFLALWSFVVVVEIVS
jgi:hypothetical protein